MTFFTVVRKNELPDDFLKQILYLFIMATDKEYFVYILSNRTQRLYVGFTSNLAGRICQHKQHLIDGFAKHYNIDRLVYFESTNDAMDAICREKQIKKYRREKKIKLIESMNPEWRDLAKDWDATDAW